MVTMVICVSRLTDNFVQEDTRHGADSRGEAEKTDSVSSHQVPPFNRYLFFILILIAVIWLQVNESFTCVFYTMQYTWQINAQ